MEKRNNTKFIYLVFAIMAGFLVAAQLLYTINII